MQIPNLPTDNLYKFMAIAGLALIIISVIIPLWIIHDLKIKGYDLKIEMAIIDVEAKSFEKQFQLHTQVPHNKKELSDHSHKQYFATVLDMEKNIAKTKGQVDKLEFLRSEIQKMRVIIALGLGLGLILTFNGFRLWYSRLQKYQDAAIKSEAQKQPHETTDK